jgi:hypothetical protein
MTDDVGTGQSARALRAAAAGFACAAAFGTAVAIRDDLPGEPLGIRVRSRCPREYSLDGGRRWRRLDLCRQPPGSRPHVPVTRIEEPLLHLFAQVWASRESSSSPSSATRGLGLRRHTAAVVGHVAGSAGLAGTGLWHWMKLRGVEEGVPPIGPDRWRRR